MTQHIIALLLFVVFLTLLFTISSEQPNQASIWTILKSWFGRLNKIFELNLKPEKCVNSCGDGACQSKFCVGKNCPCPETYANCPTDCGNTPVMQPQPTPTKDSGQQNDVCVNKCPDGLCEEIVCLGTGCPCAETPSSCPQDCAKSSKPCTEEAKVCPDGSTVGRVGPNCEYAPCPTKR